MAIVTLSEVKGHLRIEDESQDAALQLMIDAVEEFISNMTGLNFDETNKLAKVACFFLVQDLYDNRQINPDKASEKIRQVVVMILTQLSYSYSEEEE